MFRNQLVIIKVFKWINALPWSFLPPLADNIVVLFMIFTLFFVADRSILRSGGEQMSCMVLCSDEQ